MKRVCVLISGRGSNLGALINAARTGDFEVASVLSNRPGARGLDVARDAGIPHAVIDHEHHADREAFDAELASAISRLKPDLIVLAGFMRILTTRFVLDHQGRMINIHPSLLPRHPGLRTHARALEAGDRIHGASVHFVTPELDGGPVIAQATMPVLPGDTAATLAERLLPLEHRLIVACVREVAADRIALADNRVVHDGLQLTRPLQLIDTDALAPDRTCVPPRSP